MDNGPAGPAKTITRPRTYGDEKEKSDGPAGPAGPPGKQKSRNTASAQYN